jgi:lipid-A-disaccharide synthase
MIIAGEASGDLHAAHLVKALKTQNPQLTFSGLGGQLMAESGVEIFEDLTQKAVVGFAEVLKHYGEFRRIFYFILCKVRDTRPAAVILVDYPGFNLRLAKALKPLGVRIYYYISPQVWAWKANRIRLIKRYVDRMLVLFAFEKDFYARHGLEVEFVGHPLVDLVQPQTSRDAFLQKIELIPNHLTIGILPGSRQREVQTLLPIMLQAANILYQEFSPLQFLIFRASTIGPDEIERLRKDLPFPLRIKMISKDVYDGINACDVCMVASGTATLETAILKKPMVVVYKTSFLTWVLAKLFIKIPFIGLVNIVNGKKIVPECLQFRATGRVIAQELKGILTNEVRIAQIRSELEGLREKLGPPGASQRAAGIILKDLG